MQENQSQQSTKSLEQHFDLPPIELIHRARKLWLSATTETDLVEVESLYRQALRIDKEEKKKKRKKCGGDGDNSEYSIDPGNNNHQHQQESKTGQKRKLTSTSLCLKSSECKKACEKLALLLCQSGRSKKAKSLLNRLGYICRLSEEVLDYDIPGQSQVSKVDTDKNASRVSKSPPCCILDHFLSTTEIRHLCSIFQSPTASYWESHNYAVEPPSPYFSYIIPLSTHSPKSNQVKDFGFVGQLVNRIFQNETLRLKFPKLKDATKVEMWAHNRPNASGHQMHFDSDDEGRGGIRNPIISTILYITAGCGGPSLLTNQKLDDVNLASKGWLCYPKCERLVAFDGRYLHGVIPGKGAKSGRRVTLMFAFWSDIRTRIDDGPGSARPFPTQDKECKWAEALISNDTQQTSKHDNTITDVLVATEVEPVCIERVYETLSGKKWTKSKGLPDYNAVFQGF